MFDLIDEPEPEDQSHAKVSETTDASRTCDAGQGRERAAGHLFECSHCPAKAAYPDWILTREMAIGLLQINRCWTVLSFEHTEKREFICPDCKVRTGLWRKWEPKREKPKFTMERTFSRRRA